MNNKFVDNIKEIVKMVRKMDNDTLIQQVEPNCSIGRNLLYNSDADVIIDLIVEQPLQEACKIFRNKGIETVMSSANRNNILKDSGETVEKEDLNIEDVFDSTYSFEDAGRGYAWIMLNYNSLSEENKKILFDIEGKTKGKAVWFVTPFFNNKYNTDIKDEFNKRAVFLEYNDRYPDRVAMLRMPVDNTTSIGDVEKYFSTIAKIFKQQELNKDNKNNHELCLEEK